MISVPRAENGGGDRPFGPHDQLHPRHIPTRNPEDFESQLPEEEQLVWEERADLSKKLMERRKKRAEITAPVSSSDGSEGSDVDPIFDEDGIIAKKKFYVRNALLARNTLTPQFPLSKNRVLVGNFSAFEECVEFLVVKMEGGEVGGAELAQVVSDPQNSNRITLSRTELKVLCGNSGPICRFLEGHSGQGSEAFGREKGLLMAKPPPLVLNKAKCMFGVVGKLMVDIFMIPDSENALAMFTFWQHGYMNVKRVSVSLNFAAFRNLVFVAGPLMNNLFNNYLEAVEKIAKDTLGVTPPLLLGFGSGFVLGNVDDDDEESTGGGVGGCLGEREVDGLE